MQDEGASMLESAAKKQGEDASDSENVEEPLVTSAADQVLPGPSLVAV